MSSSTTAFQKPDSKIDLGVGGLSDKHGFPQYEQNRTVLEIICQETIPLADIVNPSSLEST